MLRLRPAIRAFATKKLNLNADLGEGFGPWRLTDDAALMELVTSANVACGGHAGDAATMVRACALAADRGVSIGAHPGYDDKPGFGRRVIPLSMDEVEGLVASQVGALRSRGGVLEALGLHRIASRSAGAARLAARGRPCRGDARQAPRRPEQRGLRRRRRRGGDLPRGSSRRRLVDRPRAGGLGVAASGGGSRVAGGGRGLRGPGLPRRRDARSAKCGRRAHRRRGRGGGERRAAGARRADRALDTGGDVV